MKIRDGGAARRRAALVIGSVVGLIALEPIASAQGDGDPMAGRELYQSKCGGCHSLDTNRVGPAHRGVVGRRIASVPGYTYSAATMKLGGVWTAARLDQWLQGPQKMAPGSKMFFSVADAKQRRDIIAYLIANSSVNNATPK